MLNEVAVEGTVIGNSWRWSSDTLFRLGVDRDVLRQRKGTGARDASDYFTVRASAQVLGVFPVQFRQGMRVRVHGFLQSREHEENLKAFLLRAHGPAGALSIGDETAEQIALTRVVTEIMAERITIAPEPARAGAAVEPAQKPRRPRNGVNAPPADPAESKLESAPATAAEA